jgi:hypothetical protein
VVWQVFGGQGAVLSGSARGTRRIRCRGGGEEKLLAFAFAELSAPSWPSHRAADFAMTPPPTPPQPLNPLLAPASASTVKARTCVPCCRSYGGPTTFCAWSWVVVVIQGS